MGVLLTIVNLLKGDLGVMWETLHSLAGQHERLRLLRRRHDSALLRIHLVKTANSTCQLKKSHCFIGCAGKTKTERDHGELHQHPARSGIDVPSNTLQPQ